MKHVLFPLSAFVTAILIWQGYVLYYDIPVFILPSPMAVIKALILDFQGLLAAAFTTMVITLWALIAAVISGTMLALTFSLSRTFELTFYPFAVILQVTPIVAIAPLIIIWVGLDNVDTAQVIIAWLVAFFPVLANMSAGLKSVDKNLNDLFTLYKASKWQRFWLLLWPTSMPYLLASLKISGGLALVGSVVAEFVAGSGSSTGIAWRIIEAGNRLQIAKMFAGLVLLIIMGVIIFYGFSFLEKMALRRQKQ
ncbi:ABC transporter permease [Kordiimonas pumila]|uniref:ABC transporter permease n=1 Tax=Kordiimonas pumila TaxID=2161677 RepID=A0ABV7D1G8_9PROT|nr:ABC transporter permease [Kordiimonas pumila]